MDTHIHEPITRAVFSWWTKPGLLGNYRSMKFHLASWIVAIEFAKKLFDEVEIYSDVQGKKILKSIGYEANDELESLDINPGFRAGGKLLTYKLQNKPFIHLDSDCFLWKKLPDDILRCGLFAQNEESDDWFKSAYQGQIDYMFGNGFLLPEHILKSKVRKASCLGIVGGNDYEFISSYASESLEMIKSNNRDGMQDVGLYNVIFEQRMFDVLAERMGKKVQYLTYPNIDKEKLTHMGYQHLWGAKKDKKTEQMVLEFCKMEYPHLFKLL